jgi:hypothetical protein
VAFSGSVFVIRVIARSPCSTFVRRVSPDTSLVTVEWISTRIAVLCEDFRRCRMFGTCERNSKIDVRVRGMACVGGEGGSGRSESS